MKNYYILFVATICSISALAEKGKIIDIKTGKSSEMITLTNGACFKIDNSMYRLELDNSKDAILENKFKNLTLSIRLNQVGAKEAFNLITQLSRAPIVCTPGVKKDIHVDINARDESILSIVNKICTQIGATYEIKDESIRIIQLPESK